MLSRPHSQPCKWLVSMILALWMTSPLSGQSFTVTRYSPTAADSARITERSWQWGVGRAHVLDTYLTPFSYVGPDFTILHSTQRPARWGSGRVITYSRYGLHFASVHGNHADSHEFDGELSAAGGWLYTLLNRRDGRIAIGGLMGLSSGFTYNVRGTNNPAQGRLGTDFSAALMADYRLPFLPHYPITLHSEMSAPLLGAQFAPNYGQSYYEIFSLGHAAGVVHLTTPFSCPTLWFSSSLRMPLAGAIISLGYVADIRQSQLGGLRRHAWRHTFMIGYVRNSCLLRPRRH